VDSSGPSPASSSETCRYVLAFTEDASDCVLCPVAYLELDGRDFAYHQPYAIKRYLEVIGWEAAKTESEALLQAFREQLAEDEREEV
jgi:hypothetical protein